MMTMAACRDIGSEDLVQITLEKIFLRWEYLNEHDLLAAYSRRTLLHSYIGNRRQRRWSFEVSVAELPDYGGPDEANETDQALRAALDGLGGRQRTVIMLRFWNDLNRPYVCCTTRPGRTGRRLRPGPLRGHAARRPAGPSVLAADLSSGMLLAAGRPALRVDAAALPLRDGTCGAVLAMHMLYHVPEPEVTVAELARVRAPGGTALISTNGADDKRRIHSLHAEVVRDLFGSGVPARRNLSRRFSLDKAERVARRHFGSVQRIDFHGVVSLPATGPLLRWLGSITGPDLVPEVLREAGDRAATVIAREGAFRIDTHDGFLVC